MVHKNLNNAKEAKKDEFYIQLEDINNELRHCREHFRGKTVLCDCDDPRISNFFKFILGMYNVVVTGYRHDCSHRLIEEVVGVPPMSCHIHHSVRAECNVLRPE